MKKKKVLVTGGTGFIGKEVVKQLLKKSYFVVIADDFSNSTPQGESDSLRVINFDLTKHNGILKIFEGVQYCIHLAARVGGIKYMNLNQSEILKDNILIDTNTISTASQRSVKIVYASTVIVYDQSKELPFKEDQMGLPVPKSYYGFSKLVGEKLCQSYGRDLQYSIARICNVSGINPNEIPEQKLHVIPDLIRKISQEKKLQLYNNGIQRRTFVHVSDVAKALVLMMENQSANGEIFNIATDEHFQIQELAKMIWQIIKREPFNFENIPSPDEDYIESIADFSKIKEYLGWNANISLKDSLPEIIKWYQNHYETKAIK